MNRYSTSFKAELRPGKATRKASPRKHICHDTFHNNSTRVSSPYAFFPATSSADGSEMAR